MWIFLKLPKPVQGGGMLILILLCINPFIQIFRYASFCQHKEQVIIEQTSYIDITWSDDNSYYNGQDNINLSIDVTFKKEEVSSFNAHTVVFKGDQYIGYIDSDFYGTSERVTDKGNTLQYFETNSKQTLYFHISHATNTSWSGDELFQQLFEGNIEEFTFITNVICVYFTDGTMVGHYLFLPDDFYYDENGIINFKDKNSDEKRYYYYDSKGNKHYVKSKSNNTTNTETSNDNSSITDNIGESNKGNSDNTLRGAVKNYAGNDAILPENYSDVIYHTQDCGWYSYADEEYHDSYYISFKVDEKSAHIFVENFINQLIGDGYTLQYDEYHYEYVKNNTVICFSNILESQVDGQLEYYYMQYYAYSLN